MLYGTSNINNATIMYNVYITLQSATYDTHAHEHRK